MQFHNTFVVPVNLLIVTETSTTNTYFICKHIVLNKVYNNV